MGEFLVGRNGWKGLRVKKSFGMIVTCINFPQPYLFGIQGVIMFKGKKCARNVDSQKTYF